MLVVEDEAVVLEDLRDLLTDLGHVVVAATDSGPEAVRLAEEHRPGLALLDIHIRGGIDGIEVARQLSRLDVPVVFVTANRDTATLDAATATEPFGFVVKPFSERDIRAAVSVALYRHRAERKVRDMEAWLSTTLQSIGDAVLTADVAGRVTYLNAMAEMLTGWTRYEAIGQPLAEVFEVRSAAGRGPIPQIVEEVLRSGLVFHLTHEYEVRHRSGRFVPIDDSIAPIRRQDGAVEGVVVVFRDRTTRKRAEEARAAFEARTRDAQRLESLGLLAGGVAHDFNNLLAVVLSNASLEREEAEPGSPLAEALDTIMTAARRGAGLCKQLLSYAGRGPDAHQALDLGALVHETSALLQVSLPKNVRLVLDLDADVPWVRGDTTQLQQVLMNLVLNAAEALDQRPGQVILRLRQQALDASQLATARVGHDVTPGDYVVLEVEDTGLGMSSALQARIFEPFFTTKPTGRGMGLAAVLGVVRSHMGVLLLRSAEGQGTTFGVALAPVSRPKTWAAVEVARDIAWRGAGTVLVAEDEEAVAHATRRILERLGFAVELVSDGAALVRSYLAAPGRYRLIVTDVTMPELDGLTALRQIRDVYPDAPAVVVTGYSAPSLESTRASRAPTQVVLKPFGVEALREATKRVLTEAHVAP
jgi:PAS domain S-box-containing protein